MQWAQTASLIYELDLIRFYTHRILFILKVDEQQMSTRTRELRRETFASQNLLQQTFSEKGNFAISHLQSLPG